MNSQAPEAPMPQHSWDDEVALNQLRGDVQSPEDEAYLDQVDKDLGNALQQKVNLGHDAIKLVQLQDGTVTTTEAVQADREAGHDMSSEHVGGRV